jgi:hypothetical protein
MKRPLIYAIIVGGLAVAAIGGYFLAVYWHQGDLAPTDKEKAANEAVAVRNEELTQEITAVAAEKAKLAQDLEEKSAEIAENVKQIARLEEKNASFLSGFHIVDVGIADVEIIAERIASGGAISGPFAVKVTVSNLTDEPLQNIRVLATLNASSPEYPKSLPIASRKQRVIAELDSDASTSVVLIGFNTLFPEIRHDLTVEIFSSLSEDNLMDNSKTISLPVAPPWDAEE